MATTPRIVTAITIIIVLIAITGSIFDMKLSRDWADSISAWSNLVLVVVAGIGVVCTTLALWSGNEKERYLKIDLASANEVAAVAKQGAANANERAAIMKRRPPSFD